MSSEFKKYLKESLYENHPSMRSNTTRGTSNCKPCQVAKVERLAEEFGSILSENSSEIISSVLSEGFDIASLITMFKPLLQKLMNKFGVDTSDIFDMAEDFIPEGYLQNLMLEQSGIPIEDDDDDDWIWILIIVIIGGLIVYQWSKKKKKKRNRPTNPGGGGGGGGDTAPGSGGGQVWPGSSPGQGGGIGDLTRLSGDEGWA